MPSYTTPGVYVSESPLRSQISAIPGGTSAVFFGEAERGPTDPVLIRDWNSYRTTYGNLSNSYDLGFAVYHYFANGGRAAYVSRVVGAAASVSTLSPGIAYYPTGTGAASASLATVSALSPGTWGNRIGVSVSLDGEESGTDNYFGTFAIVVTFDGTEVERWTELTLDPDSSRYFEQVVNNYSNFIRVSNVAAATMDEDLTFDTTAVTLAGGADSVPNDSDYTAAYDGIDGLDGNLLLNAVGRLTGIGNLISKAEQRGDSFVIVDASKASDSVNDLKSDVASIGQSAYAAFYGPCLLMSDPTKSGGSAIRTTYPGGAVAGLITRTEVEQSVAKAPAGWTSDIRGAYGTLFKLTDTQIGELYTHTVPVNSFRTIPGGGIVVWGARTLKRTNPDKWISVRRTLGYLKYNLKVIVGFAVFENNDGNLWTSINMRCAGFLGDFWRNGGLKGDTPGQAFYVLCDESNNTPASIEAGIVNVEVGVALQTPAEFIQLNISQWTGGSNVAESL